MTLQFTASTERLELEGDAKTNVITMRNFTNQMDNWWTKNCERKNSNWEDLKNLINTDTKTIIATYRKTLKIKIPQELPAQFEAGIAKDILDRIVRGKQASTWVRADILAETPIDLEMNSRTPINAFSEFNHGSSSPELTQSEIKRVLNIEDQNDWMIELDLRRRTACTNFIFE